MTSPADFSKISRAKLEGMEAAGEEAVDCMRVLAKTNDNIVGELLREVETFYEWDHHPDGDVFDPESHSQYYYHAHPQEERIGEHGHFHTFVRPGGMPKGIEPAPLPDYEPPEDPDDALSHLVAISMEKHGVPIRLFTTNRWVTGEAWHVAADVIKLVDQFEIDLARPSWPVNRWITAILHLFRPQITDILHQRDAKMAEWIKAHPDENAYEDRDLEITSQIHISIDDQLASIRAAL